MSNLTAQQQYERDKYNKVGTYFDSKMTKTISLEKAYQEGFENGIAESLKDESYEKVRKQTLKEVMEMLPEEKAVAIKYTGIGLDKEFNENCKGFNSCLQIVKEKLEKLKDAN